MKPEQLPAFEGRLMQEALDARSHAYAPYSQFTVGAAVLAGSGSVYRGVNVENASYGMTVCAERTAVFAAIAAGERIIREVAIVTGAATISPPCGACRQVIVEFGREAIIRAANLAGLEETWSIGDLLPHAFDRSSLELQTIDPEVGG
jgi:cytidine deaminase